MSDIFKPAILISLLITCKKVIIKSDNFYVSAIKVYFQPRLETLRMFFRRFYLNINPELTRGEEKFQEISANNLFLTNVNYFFN